MDGCFQIHRCFLEFGCSHRFYTYGSWTATKSLGAPSPRYGQTAVWTGSKMIVFGGYDSTAALNTGRIYDVRNDSWSSIATLNAPLARGYPTSVWTGSENDYIWRD